MISFDLGRLLLAALSKRELIQLTIYCIKLAISDSRVVQMYLNYGSPSCLIYFVNSLVFMGSYIVKLVIIFFIFIIINLTRVILPNSEHCDEALILLLHSVARGRPYF